jgi:hypothetical protein
LVDRTPLEQRIRAAFPENRETHNVITKLEIDVKEADKVRELLLKAGYGPARLFPGLGGIVAQLLQQV